MDEHRLRSELNHGIIKARADYYRERYHVSEQYSWWKYYKGRELALRDLARRMKIDVVDEETTKISGILTWEHEMAEQGYQQTPDLVEYIVRLRRGEAA